MGNEEKEKANHLIQVTQKAAHLIVTLELKNRHIYLIPVKRSLHNMAIREIIRLLEQAMAGGPVLRRVSMIGLKLRKSQEIMTTGLM